MLTKHAIVMLPSHGVDDRLTFIADESDDGSGQGYPQITLSAEVYADMGEPDSITVTVEPGDLLNEVSQ